MTARRPCCLRMRGAARFLGLVAATALASTACNGLAPLKAPIAADRTVTGAAHIVLSNGDLGQLAEAIRLSAGKSVDAPVAPLTVPGTGGAKLAATTLAVDVAKGEASLGKLGRVGFSYPLAAAPTTVELLGPTGSSCTMGVDALSGAVAVALRFARSPDGAARVILADAPVFTLQGGELQDQTGCLAKAPPGAADAVAVHLRAALRTALEGSYVATARAVLKVVLPVDAELAGVAPAGPDNGPKIRLLSAYASPSGSITEAGSLLEHNGNFASAALSVGLDVARHPCAIDVPPPGVPALPLTVTTPPSPAGSFLLRRAVVVDRALLAHLTWVAQRAGLFCRRVRLGDDVGAGSGWAAAVLPALAGWVDGPPTRARLWPGEAATMQLFDRTGGAGIRLRLPAATLEVAAQVAGVEAVVLTVHGTIVLELHIANGPLDGAGLVLDSAAMANAVVRSPLLGSAAPAPSALVEPLGKLLTATIGGALAGLSPPGFQGASVVASSRVGGRLWLWLEEAPPSGG